MTKPATGKTPRKPGGKHSPAWAAARKARNARRAAERATAKP